MALVHRDFSQQEPRIAAVLSGDPALLEACEAGDLYLGIAAKLGFTPDSRPSLRDLFKIVVLAILYGLKARSLALHAGISLYEAGEILARLRATFHVYEEFCHNVADHAGLTLALSTCFGWTVYCPPGTNPRTIRNWPIQATAAAILHLAIILAERRGIRIVAPIHDALLAEGPISDITDISIALDRVMRDAAALVLQGYELPTADEIGPILPGQRFFDKRGEAMWNEINRLLEKVERRIA
jgi:DNA polymerase I-like protein with 3'-5' exonuclease and polymerase domains